MKILISGGGTGGHVNPGLALASYIKEKHEDADIRFGGAKTGIESKLVPKASYHLYSLDIKGLSREKNINGIFKNFSAISKTISCINEAKKILKDFKPDIVIGTGGYASFPFVYAAQKLKIPTALLEVNALAGIATKMLSQHAKAVFTSFKETENQLKTKDNIHLTGAPVRGEMLYADRKSARKKLGIGEHDKLVVSFWGSMGALYMNKHMIDFAKIHGSQNKFYHVHAMGHAASKWMPTALKNEDIDLENKFILEEYIYNMDETMAAADLIICRAGAATLGELCLLSKPSIIVPSPYVAENHQEKNALELEKISACVLIREKECTGEKLYEETLKLIFDDEKLKDMGKNAKKLANIDAVTNIYDNIIKIINKKQ